MAAKATESLKPRWPSVVAAFMLHACIVSCVVLLPPIVYEAVRSSSYREIDWLHFSGAATYPLYAIYWIAKLKNFRAKFILLHLTFVLAITFFTALTSNRSTPMLVEFLPTAASALPLFGAVASWLYGSSRLAFTCLVSSLLALLIGVPSSFLIIYGVAMSAVGPIRY